MRDVTQNLFLVFYLFSMQQSVRDMVTPDEVELRSLSKTFHSLDLQTTSLSSFKSTLENHSVRRLSRFPLIQRSRTEPFMMTNRKHFNYKHKTKTPGTLNQKDKNLVASQKEKALQSPAICKGKLHVMNDQENIPVKAISGDNLKNDKDTSSSDFTMHPKLFGIDSVLKCPLVKTDAGRIAIRHTEPDDMLTKEKSLLVSYCVLSDSEETSSFDDSVETSSEYHTTSRHNNDKKYRKINNSYDDSIAFKAAPENKLVCSTCREYRKGNQKISLPTLLSMGIGSLKDPYDFQYQGIIYAPWSLHATKKARKSATWKKKDFKQTKKENYVQHEKCQSDSPVQIRIQNFFADLDELISKPKVRPLWPIPNNDGVK